VVCEGSRDNRKIVSSGVADVDMIGEFTCSPRKTLSLRSTEVDNEPRNCVMSHVDQHETGTLKTSGSRAWDWHPVH
jgi:hypothetical protein